MVLFSHRSIRPLFCLAAVLFSQVSLPPLNAAAPGPSVSGSFSSITAGSAINLSSVGKIDWVHWGLYTETSLDRKAGVVPQISDFTVLDSPAGLVYAYQFADNANGYSWSDGTPTAVITNTTTGVWAYGTPQIGTGFQITAPADTATRTLSVYVGAYGARGKMEAYLSDGSASGYTNTSLFNPNNGPSGVYTLSYAAGSAGQQLVVRWTLNTPARPDGNVTLQAAALTSSNANNPPFVLLTSPVDNSKFSAGGDITLTANASDFDSTVAKVEFFTNSFKVGEDATSPYSFAWSNVLAGVYVLTAVATESQGGASTSSPVEIFVNGSGGSLTGSLTVPPNLPTSVNLTAEGTADWTHWGLATNSLFNRKASVAAQISNFTKIGTNAVARYTDNYTGYSWSDGTPAASASSTTTGIFTSGATNGFELTAPADTTSRTLKVYVGLYGAQGDFQAWLSDFSTAAYTDITLSNVFGSSYAVYSLTYKAASAGQTLIVRYRAKAIFDSDFGNVTLQAATLFGNSSAAPVTLQNPAWNGADFIFSFASQAGHTYEAQYIDALGSGGWHLLATLTGNDLTLSVTNRTVSAMQRFYRVESK